MHTFNYHPDQNIDYFHSPRKFPHSRSIGQIIFKLKHKYSSKERIFSFHGCMRGVGKGEELVSGKRDKVGEVLILLDRLEVMPL